MNHGDNRHHSEVYRVAAKDWVDKESAASMLEETKSAVLAQMMLRQGEMPVSRAEMQVKASEEWHDFITKMVRAREATNLAKVKLKYIEMRYFEAQGESATKRAEMRL